MNLLSQSTGFLSRISFGRAGACLGLAVLSLTPFARAAGPWTADLGFSSTQGANQWSYLQRPIGGGTATNMAYSTGAWRTTDTGQTGWMIGYATHPGQYSDTIRRWTAPSSGTISITGRVYKIDIGGGAGVVATVQHNGTTLWTRTVAYNDSTGYTTDEALGDVSVASGDTIDFVVDDNGTYGFDRTGWDPTITFIGSWTASVGYTSTQGANQWNYVQRPAGGGTITNMAFSTSAWRTTDSGMTGWMQGNDTHPGNGIDTIRQWTAPSAGTISISGRVYKMDTGGGAGIIATVEKNGTSLWSKTVAYNDSVGYTTDSALGNVNVASGDKINFVVDDNGTFAFDQTGWNPTISLFTSSNPSWVLNTTDTLLTLTIIGNQPAISRLEDASNGWNWTPTPVTVPLINMVYISGAFANPIWTYTSAAVDTTSGTKVTLTFTSASPSLTLTQVWWAHPGVGPVEESSTVTNNSGGSIVINDQDIIPADVTVTADATTTLHRFARASYNGGGDTYFSTGVINTTLAATTSAASTVSNDYGAGSYLLPFSMLDVGGVHGLYLGYTNDFGLYTTSTTGNAEAIRTVFNLWNSGSMTVANSASLAIPGVFYGTYTGDIEVGSNHMKQWFYANHMTPTIKSTAAEPLVEYDIPANSTSDATSFFAANALSSWGVELAKEDYLWTSDSGDSNPPFGDLWSPNSGWTSGNMNLGSLAHNAGVKLALYMSNTYNGADLSTSAGVSSEESALEGRFNGTLSGWSQTNGPAYDYWRSDMISEAPYNYGAHLGLMQVLDYMITNHSNFRWENCSSGGSKKSFDLLQRQSVMTTEDSGAASGSTENYRRAFYANSYMINPVQLKDDNGNFSPNTDTWAKYMFRTGFYGAWMFGADGTGSFQETEYAAHITLYKTYQRPILRGADVYHILPICDGTNWDGLELFNPTLNKGSVILLKPNSGVGNSPTIHLRGLNPTGTYTLKFQDRTSMNSTYVNVTGSTLMADGISISGTTTDYDSEIIWINTGP